MRKILVVIVAVAAGVMVTAFEPTAPTTVAVTDESENFGVFYTHCEYDHTAPDDPIVHAGMPGMSHSHDFFGAKGIDAFSTPASTVGKSTTCKDLDDTAGYWVPSLYVDGQQVLPQRVNVRVNVLGKDPSTVEPWPAGLVMVAGSLMHPAPAGSEHIDWSCRPGNPYERNQIFRPCGSGGTVAAVLFPDCWNGVDLDSPDHRSHMAYAERPSFVCPSTHPVPVPALRARVEYGVIPTGVVTLASGETNRFHADFMNSWDQARLASLVDYCLVQRHNCGIVSSARRNALP